MGLGAQLAITVKANITKYGESVTRSRRPATDGAAVVTADYYSLWQPLSETQSAALVAEGLMNVAEANPYLVVLPHDADVDAATDYLTRDGEVWRVLNTTVRKQAGTVIDIYAYVTRERSA